MKRTPDTIRCLLIAAAITLAPAARPSGSAGPADAASRGWTCSLCPNPAGSNGHVEVGSEWVSDSSTKYGDYRGQAESGLYEMVGGTWRYLSRNGRFFDLHADRLGLENQRLDLRAGQRGRYTISLSYAEIPKYRGFGTRSVYRDSSGRLGLPEDWVTAAQTSGMTALDASLRDAALMTERTLLRGGISMRLSPLWRWDVGIEQQRKQGTRPFGAGVFLLNASHLPAPVDFTTRRLDSRLSFGGKTLQWRLAYARSEFDNHQTSITWTNPFTPLPGTEQLRASLEPDNRWQQLAVLAHWSPARWLRLSARAAGGEMKQDERLLPASINPAFSDMVLPRESAAARTDVRSGSLAGNFDARLTRRLGLIGRWQRNDRDNRTAIDLWTPVITDFVPRQARSNRPYGFDRERASLALRYRLPGSLRVQAGTMYDKRERTLQATDTTRERGSWGEIAMRTGLGLGTRLRYERSRRDANRYDQPLDGGPIDHPLLRKFHLADRQAQRLALDLDFTASSALGFSARYQLTRTEYEDTLAGLQHSEARSLNLDATVYFGPRARLSAFVGGEWIDSTQGGIENPQENPWRARTRDRFETAGAVLALQATEHIDLRLDLVRADATGHIRVNTIDSGGAFSPLETRLWRSRLEIDYQPPGRWTLRAWLTYERYDSEDWALDDLGPAGIPAVLTFGAASPDYDIAVLGLQARYAF